MATAPALILVPSNEVKIAEIKAATKLVVWKSHDGVYHETIEGIRVAMTSEVLDDILKVNDVKPEDVTGFLAVHFDRIKSAVDAAIKRMGDRV